MKVFIIGVTGGVGGLLANELLARGDAVSGLVRRAEQSAALDGLGVATHVGDIATLAPASLASMVREHDAVVFAAGSNGGPAGMTDAVDGVGLGTALAAAEEADVPRFLSVSVMPEAWRERQLSDDEEHYFAVKKRGDVLVSRSLLDWVILRPSLLHDGPGTGAVSLGAAEHHREIARADVAATLAALLHAPRIRRRIIELDQGSIAIEHAARALED